MPRALTVALVGAAFIALRTMVPDVALFDLPAFHPHFAISISLSF